MNAIGNRLPRKGHVTGRLSNRAESESLERAQVQTTTGALRVEAASQASTEAAALASAVPSDLSGTLADYEARLQDLENAP